MATGTWESTSDSSERSESVSKEWLTDTGSGALILLKGLASLKITVTLFAMGIFIVLVGTLAQVDKDMWEVIDLYFRSWFARIELQVFLPRSWFPHHQNIQGAFWFPGGALIGAAMAINLIAAHSLRFKPQSSGHRLVSGLALLAIGMLVTGYVIISGHNHAGLQGEPPISWRTLWQLVKVGIGLSGAGAIYFAMIAGADEKAKVRRRLLWLTAIGLEAIAAYLFLSAENAYFGDSGMRILWQLIQSTFCGLVLLAGCVLIFAKRGGIVLIHLGVALMMFGQFFVSKYDVEEQMRIAEGQSRSYGEDIRQTELAIIDSSDPKEDRVVAIPRSMMLTSLEPKSYLSRRPEGVSNDGTIRHSQLPFDIQIVKYFRNADIRDAKPDEPNLATTGFGKRFIAVPAKPTAGADSGGAVDLAAVYVRLYEKGGSRELGTHLLSQLASLQDLNEKVTVDGKTYELSLRFRRNYKPYQITLKDVRKDDYVGTATPRNYSSDIHLQDPKRGVDREIHIWMNNPLRYAGETFYQSGYLGPPDAEVETTTLSVVTNAGWMIPYVACMIVFVGLVAHFGTTLLRFLHRQVRSTAGPAEEILVRPNEKKLRKQSADASSRAFDVSGRASDVSGRALAPGERNQKPSPADDRQPWDILKTAGIPTLITGFFAVWLLGSMYSHKPKADQMDLRAFGKLPVIADGRVKPMDTLARNTLRVLSNRESFRDDQDKSQPAIRWLLDVMARPKDAEAHAVMRIDNPEVLDLLGLERRKSHLYSIKELHPAAEKYEQQVDKAQQDSKKLGAENLTTFQRKLLELDRRVRGYIRVAAAFKAPDLPPLPSRDEYENNRDVANQKLTEFRDAYVSFVRGIDSVQPPLVIPMKDSVHQGGESWQAYSKALATALIDRKIAEKDPPETLLAFNAMLAAYAEGDATKFNQAVADYERQLDRENPPELRMANTFWNRLVTSWFGNFYRFEEFFNKVAPFFFCWFPYLFAGALTAASWLSGSMQLRRSAYWLLVFAFIVHTVALGARIYISGRPPVTNLYSSAIFIGWAIVLFCLIAERFYKDGIPSFVASALGFATLLIAHILAGDGDTFTVLQAVLDTQFWLATHVVTVTLGYASTFLAGGLGIIYVLRGLATPTLDRAASQNLARMIYGTTCFAMVFSFIGTVLGGLWADDSWGRFWGWDPKENGALIIVMWNALVLHAKWDGMIKERGLAVLAIFGNIVTAWSWFGVNELGVGLHSYGFTEGVLVALRNFIYSQLVLIGAGCLPKNLWWSFQVNTVPDAKSGSPVVAELAK